MVYISLDRRIAPELDPGGEVSEAVDALWAHATAADGLEHASGHAGSDRLDLLLYLLTPEVGTAALPVAAQCGTWRAAALLARCHRASPSWHRRYLPPTGPGPGPGADRPIS